VSGQNATGQNAAGQNATNIEICFYFLLMLFQFVALGFKARNAGNLVRTSD